MSEACAQRIEELEHELKLLREEARQAARMKRLWQGSNEKLKEAREKQLRLQAELERRLSEIEKARDLLESIACNDKAIIDNMSEGIMITSPEGVIRQVNPAFEAITGYSAVEAVGKTPRILKSGRHDDAFYQRFWRQLEDGDQWRGEIINRSARGEEYVQDTSVTKVRDWNQSTVNYVAVMQDITDKKRQEQQLRELALYDGLTGLANRRLFREHMLTALHLANRRDLKFALLFIDLDEFKPVNDCYGHDAGDHVLVELAGRLKDTLRESDEACRFGGDEFTMLLTVIDSLADAQVAANRVLKELTRPVIWGDREIVIGASIGIACYPVDGMDYDALVNCADMRMYQAKRAGKGCLCSSS